MAKGQTGKGAAKGVSKENDRARKVLEKMKIGLMGLAITAVRMATGKPTLSIRMRNWWQRDKATQAKAKEWKRACIILEPMKKM